MCNNAGAKANPYGVEGLGEDVWAYWVKLGQGTFAKPCQGCGGSWDQSPRFRPCHCSAFLCSLPSAAAFCSMLSRLWILLFWNFSPFCIFFLGFSRNCLGGSLPMLYVLCPSVGALCPSAFSLMPCLICHMPLALCPWRTCTAAFAL